MKVNKLTEFERIEMFKRVMNICIPERFNNEFIEILKNMDFFKAPASITHHGAYTGALFDHSLAVTQTLIKFTKELNLKWGKPTSPLIVGMFHDICKANNYVLKKEKMGIKHSGEEIVNYHWSHNNAIFLPGHGEKSVMMLQQYIKLTEEELYCIRWHMGAFDSKENWDCYGRSITVYPNVLYTHTADMVAALILGV